MKKSQQEERTQNYEIITLLETIINQEVVEEPQLQNSDIPEKPSGGLVCHISSPVVEEQARDTSHHHMTRSK